MKQPDQPKVLEVSRCGVQFCEPLEGRDPFDVEKCVRTGGALSAALREFQQSPEWQYMAKALLDAWHLHRKDEPQIPPIFQLAADLGEYALKLMTVPPESEDPEVVGDIDEAETEHEKSGEPEGPPPEEPNNDQPDQPGQSR